jgi:predicted TIM-barrel fold metal-dependent hydrolase
MKTSSITADIPAIDHHSHAAYVRPGDEVRGIDGMEAENARGHIEAALPPEAYTAYIAAGVARDSATTTRLESEHGIPELIAESTRFQSTTVHAVSLREGARLLHGDLPWDDLVRVSREKKEQDFPGVWKQTLHLANTPLVLTDVPWIDASTWSPSHYKPIARLDPYTFPFGHPPFEGRGSDTPRFQRIFTTVLDELKRTAGLDEVPASLAEWRQFTLDSIAARQDAGFVGLKLATAYVRSFDIQDVDRDEAEDAYRALHGSTGVDPVAYQRLADYLVYEIAEFAMKRELPIQVHTGIGHSEPGLRLAHADPMALESFLANPRLNRLKIVLMHGGFPFTDTLTALATSHGNVFVDFSMMAHIHVGMLRRLMEEWLETLPANKVMFGTDTTAPEHHIASSLRARRLLDEVFEGGVRSGLWTPRQVDWLAERVLSQNTADVYQVGLP